MARTACLVSLVSTVGGRCKYALGKGSASSRHIKNLNKLCVLYSLYPPTAAKITRCGHVFCWSCILHYLSLSDHSWRKCPICYESIYRKDLKR
jgi:hypothetical protein